MITFHGYFRSSSSYRCRIAFGLKGVEYDFRPVHLVRGGGEQKTADYRAKNPQMLVPTVEVEGETLTQSPAILEWLDEVYPDPPLFPADAIGRAKVRAFCAAIACEIHPLQNLRVLNFLTGTLGVDEAGKADWLKKWIGDGLATCEALVANNAKTRFAFGDEPGMADIYLAPQMFSAQRFGVDLTGMPRLCAIAAAYEDHPAFVAAHPKNQPDAE
jgi:maleylacetoacetate isomerase